MLGKADVCKKIKPPASPALFLFHFYKNEKKTLATHRNEWINAASPTHVDKWHPCTHVRDFNIFTHVHTGLCTEDTQYVTYVQRPHKDSTTRSIPTHTHVTLPQRTEEENGFSGRTKGTCGSLESSTSSTYTRTSPLARFCFCFFLRKMLKI